MSDGAERARPGSFIVLTDVPMLLDDLMPVYDAAERHRISVRATPAIVFAAITSFDLSDSLLTRTLLVLRAVPAALVAMVRSPRTIFAELRARRAELRFVDFERAGFRVVAERPPEELVIGVLGKFWSARGELRADVSAAHFAADPPPAYALAAWNFTVFAQPDGTTLLRTETRVRCAPDARLRFRLYWILIRPASGLMRRAMLRSIRRQAERVSDHRSPTARKDARR